RQRDTRQQRGELGVEEARQVGASIESPAKRGEVVPRHAPPGVDGQPQRADSEVEQVGRENGATGASAQDDVALTEEHIQRWIADLERLRLRPRRTGSSTRVRAGKLRRVVQIDPVSDVEQAIR